VPLSHGVADERVNGPVGDGAVAWPMPYAPCHEPPEYRRWKTPSRSTTHGFSATGAHGACSHVPAAPASSGVRGPVARHGACGSSGMTEISGASVWQAPAPSQRQSVET
jgi:hypothetical protein